MRFDGGPEGWPVGTHRAGRGSTPDLRGSHEATCHFQRFRGGSGSCGVERRRCHLGKFYASPRNKTVPYWTTSLAPTNCESKKAAASGRTRRTRSGPFVASAVSASAAKGAFRGRDQPPFSLTGTRLSSAKLVRPLSPCALLGTWRSAVFGRLLTVAGVSRRSPRRAGLPRIQVPGRLTAGPARSPVCHSVSILLASEHGSTQCHLCLVCHHLWDVDKTRRGRL